MKKQLLFLSFLIFSFTLFAQNFTIDSYDVSIEVHEDGSFDVVEDIQVMFHKDQRGIFRTIPYEYKVDGKKKKIKIKNFRVDNWKSKNYRENKNEILRIGDADVYVNGRQNYMLRYTVEDAFLVYDDHAEFYWNVIGKEWETDILKASLNIVFPDEEDLIEYKLFAGERRSDHGKFVLRQRGSEINGESLESLNRGDGISVAVKMPLDAVQLSPASSSPASKSSESIRERNMFDWIAALPLAMFALFLQWWRKKGRNNISFESLQDVAYAPAAMSAAEAGSRIDFRVNNRDLMALIPQWGREGYIKITGPQEVGRFKSAELFVERLKELPGDFPEHEHILFDSLFEDGDIVMLSRLEHKFYRHFEKARRSLKNQLQLKDSYDPESYAVFHKGWFLAIGLICLGLSFYFMIALGLIITGLAIIAFAIMSFVIHFSSPKKKEDALRLQQDLKDFKWFLQNSPEDKLKEVVEKDPNYFENVYPYVVAFGIDKQFMKRISPYMDHGPSWYYYGDHMGHSQRAPFKTFNNQFNITHVSSAFTSQPGTSGSGSSTTFSSGSSGGGFGGGGGGSW